MSRVLSLKESGNGNSVAYRISMTVESVELSLLQLIISMIQN